MTKSKLLELYFKYQNKEITLEEIEELKFFTNEQIDIILNSKNKNDIMTLFKNENFKSLSKELQLEIIDIVNNLDPLSGYTAHIIKVATNKEAISNNNLLEIIKIISQSIDIYHLDKAALVAINPNAIASGHVLELVKILSNNGNDLDIINIAFKAAIDPFIIRSGQVLQVVKTIINSKNKQDAITAYYKYLNQFKGLTLLSALSNGTIKEVDFWNFFREDSEKAINLIIQRSQEDEITSNIKMNKDFEFSSKPKK